MSLPRCARSLERSTMMRPCALLVLLVSSSLALTDSNDVCGHKYCDCVPAEHPSWIRVNCTAPPHTAITIQDGALPETMTELIATGSDTFTLESNSLSRLQDLRRLRITGFENVILRRGAAVNLNVVNAYLEVEDCRVLTIEQKSFINIRGPLTVTINNCFTVSMEGEVFSWLLKLTITNVRNLILSPGSFKLDPTASNLGEHGPGMSIVLKNVTSPEFPGNAFGSSADEIVLEKVEVRKIRDGAFSANTYNMISATDSTFHEVEAIAFAEKSQIHTLRFHDCKIHQLKSGAVQSAITKLDVKNTRFDMIATSAINITVASVLITDSEFHTFMTRGFQFTSWNSLMMKRNKFDTVAPFAIVAPTSTVHELFFVNNEIEGMSENSFAFVGQTYESRFRFSMFYQRNYYGVPCNCNISLWVANGLGATNGEPFDRESYCTVDVFFARCFNEPEQNMYVAKFLNKVCDESANIQCEGYKTKTNGKPTEIKNPRFPHKTDQGLLSEGDKKVISIIVITAIVSVAIVILATFIRWMVRRGYCARIKNFCVSSNSRCGAMCNRLCRCDTHNELNNTRSMSHFSIVEYSERRRLNDPTSVQDIMLETLAPVPGSAGDTALDDKTTQTLPEELTKELLENLRARLDDPSNYVEAREMIEHLYELIKTEDEPSGKQRKLGKVEENIYEMPFDNATLRIGKNNKEMTSVGTTVPSLEKLSPASPYDRQTALAHEYFEPMDLAVHLYAEIINNDKDKRRMLGNIPDIVEQVVPRGPYLEKMMVKMRGLDKSPPKAPPPTPSGSNITSPNKTTPTMKSNKSTSSTSSGNMINRPLPEKPEKSESDVAAAEAGHS